MLVLFGESALSSHQRVRLEAELSESCGQSVQVAARNVYFVDFASPLSVREREVLQSILHAQLASEVSYSQQSLVVVPRISTLSPWSSKTTSLVHGCGLENVLRVERGILFDFGEAPASVLEAVKPLIHHRMTESVLRKVEDAKVLFAKEEARPLRRVDILNGGEDELHKMNREWGLALDDDEVVYLVESFRKLGRNPSDAELMMFAQVNSEHCRHKIFNASWTIDGKDAPNSLFGMIRNTHKLNPQGTLSAYSDNAAVMEGSRASRFAADPKTRAYDIHEEDVHILMKVETHNHPTAIEPWAGAATGSGGEIRDEGATGRGSRPKAGLSGFSVSNLHIPGAPLPWEQQHGKPDTIVSAYEIMMEGPIGGAAYNNEFGRPNITGYFRTFEQTVPGAQGEEIRGYHKPIMLAGGLGNVRAEHVQKAPVKEGAALVVLGGPAMLIGVGGGAASSITSDLSDQSLDFASVQRANPELQLRCQHVINHCAALGDRNPILTIHDVGAGGLSNAMPEIVHDAGFGAELELRKVPSAQPELSPMELWCNESQERYVLAINESQLEEFEALCKRERAPYAVLGRAITEQALKVSDSLLGEPAVDLPMDTLFGKPPRMHRDATTLPVKHRPFDASKLDVKEALERVLRNPTVGNKNFILTIGDRSVTGLVARDQMVGKWQLPLADVGVTASSFCSNTGEAMAMGERTPLALIDGPASARMGVTESILNIIAAPIRSLDTVKLSANWMAPAGYPGNDSIMYDMVEAIGMDFCPALGVAIPVGKDSMSMQTVWDDEGVEKRVVAPMSVVLTAFAAVDDVNSTLTPVAMADGGSLIHVRVSERSDRLGASILAYCYEAIGHEAPDVEHAAKLKSFVEIQQKALRDRSIIAYHDVSDGGLLITALEMAFAGRTSLKLSLGEDHSTATLFAEEPGAVMQAAAGQEEALLAAFRAAGLHAEVIGTVGEAPEGVSPSVKVSINDKLVLEDELLRLLQIWSETSYEMTRRRDNPETAKQEFDAYANASDTGLFVEVPFALPKTPARIEMKARPAIAILREQGVSGEKEVAAAFDRAGFAAVDVHMSDVIAGRDDLSDYAGLVVCGGASFGNVVQPGSGWANTVRYNANALQSLKRFFEREDSFTLGVCNGAQMLAQLKDLIPGAAAWPGFEENTSGAFEGRFAMVEIPESPSILLAGMHGAKMPVGLGTLDGRVVFESDAALQAAVQQQLVAMRFVDSQGQVTEAYPANPTGSQQGVTALTTTDGRVTIMMQHPERAFLTSQWPWHPNAWGENAPWMKLFVNAREFAESQKR